MGIPLTIIGGFLGAGKTSLLNHLLMHNEDVAYAVLVNDFGDLALDEDLILSHDGQTIALANGCVCCSLSNDLMETLVKVIALKPDHIVIEASGVADPGRLRDLAYLDRDLEVGGVVVVVDSAAFLSQLKDPHLTDTLEAQVGAADILLLNKCDLMPERTQLIGALRALNPKAMLAETTHGAFPFEELPRLGAADVTTAAKGPHHETVFRAHTLSGTSSLDVASLRRACADLPSSVVRMKGFVRTKDALVEIQRSGLQVDIRPAMDGTRPPALVVIGTEDMPSKKALSDLLGMH